MVTSPLVTVYITNYNYAPFLRQSINSVLGQSLSAIELLIIDDGSTDNSREIIDTYREHPQIKIIYQQNKGLNVTNNIAMRAAAGKYLMRLDADDFLESNAVQEMVQILEADPELGLVFPDYYYVNADGQRIGEERRHDFDKEVSLYDQPAHGACTMIRLEFLKLLGGYNESFTCQDGYDLWIKFITHYRVTNINKPLFSYRQHRENLTSDEARILTTRQKIKQLFVQEYLRSPSAVAVIPVRDTFINRVNLPIYRLGGKTLLERKIDTCLQAKNLRHIVVSTYHDEILSSLQKHYEHEPRVKIVMRPRSFSDPSATLSDTMKHALDTVASEGEVYDVIMSVSLEYPFVEPAVMDDAINTLMLFKADTVLSVRPDNHTYYQHTGHSLKPILKQDQYTKLEREALYKGAGGLVATSVKSFREHGKLISGKVSHIIVDQKNAFGIFSGFELQLAELALNSENHEATSSRATGRV